MNRILINDDDKLNESAIKSLRGSLMKMHEIDESEAGQLANVMIEQSQKATRAVLTSFANEIESSHKMCHEGGLGEQKEKSIMMMICQNILGNIMSYCYPILSPHSPKEVIIEMMTEAENNFNKRIEKSGVK